MSNTAQEISNRVRGIAAEKRFTQERIADTLGLARSSVSARMQGGTAFYAHELWALAREFNVDVARFYPERPASRGQTS